ncbi:aldo/keto reductase [Listeria fleischmannii]|uniref:Oxidoreductase, aldo/keto reductase family protein n=2 Tax=Listeria fleischmannii TaxID=1069827 RepID=W7DD52_9LIST|nr:aldo/keto reductase [Listeria fleischmannii]EIA21608.1 aldo/keto reductase family oxidoreductase [Listeria fleischmannii subsp. coloradonensis]EUJ52571.1 oxidoreductase, aldo/keto reductase family protein [Listeria fleischmannii FSL S10-1203]MBC1397787.1 aldo/keto reductase family oxidoreductase [Listeria fleischmannii]MBC1427448.1 aldo/keto reductase family oxidoreductase [Listeria fleischmannii]STY33874.1 Oxidoreductase YdhF [Listeria fleischmannii subsp. coloradonensis]
MEQLKLGGKLAAPSIAIGCMRMADLSVEKAEKVIRTSIENELNFFDHADIYGGGKSEEIFAEALQMTAATREKIILQSKCGIRNGFFDFSKEHIINSVDGILKRLRTEYLDVLLLHRPDTLFEPEEVAEAFSELEKSGKVRHFGVSNQNPLQIELLKKNVEQDLIANQLQFSIMHTGMIDAGLNVNMTVDAGVVRDSGILEYSRLNDMTIQAWSPFQYGFFEGVFLDNPKFPELNQAVNKLAEKYQVTNSAIAVAWILRHPAKIQTVLGTMNPERIAGIRKGADIQLTREEWYEIYRAAGNVLP